MAAPSTVARRSAGPDTLVAAAALAYAVATLVALLLPAPAKGWAVLAVSFGGCAGLVVLARAADRPAWSAALGVLIPISIFQLVPDWFLADALYVLPAEAVLGAATVVVVRATRDRPLGERLLAAAAVSTLYTGALALCWFFIDHATLTLSA